MTKTTIFVNINTINSTLIPLTQTHKIIEAYSTWRTRLVMGSPSRVLEFRPGPVRLQPGVPGRLVRGEVTDVVHVVVFLVPVLSWALHGP